MTLTEFLVSYRFELDGGGSYAPTESERAMIEDAIMSWLAHQQDEIDRIWAPYEQRTT